MKGVCVMVGDVTGTIVFHQEKPTCPVHITGYLYNLPYGYHGFIYMNLEIPPMDVHRLVNILIRFIKNTADRMMRNDISVI